MYRKSENSLGEKLMKVTDTKKWHNVVKLVAHVNPFEIVRIGSSRVSKKQRTQQQNLEPKVTRK